jgi:hypothetical protein
MASEYDPNLERIDQLRAKIEGGGDLTADEEAFLDQMAADPNYDVTVVEIEEEIDEYEG